MTVKFANNATSKLAVSISASDTTIVVLAGEGARFPVTTGGDTFPVTLVKASGQVEICRCTARSVDTLTVTRGQEGTTAAAFNSGDRIELRMTDGAFEERLGEKFDKAGGDLSGPVTLKGSGEKVIVERQASGEASVLAVKTTTGLKRWEIVLPDSATDDIAIKRFDDAGDDQGEALTIVRSSGSVQVNGAVQIAGSDNTLPVYSSPPASDKGDIHAVGIGPMKWDGSKYVAMSSFSTDDLQWLGTPIGGYITPLTPPPTDDPRFRYALCTAGGTGPGGYNEGILTDETVTGSAPLVVATAKVALAGSPFDGLTIHHINTEGRFVGAGTAESFENDSIQNITGTLAWLYNTATSTPAGSGALAVTAGSSVNGLGASSQTAYSASFDASRIARTSDHTQPSAHRLIHYRRLL